MKRKTQFVVNVLSINVKTKMDSAILVLLLIQQIKYFVVDLKQTLYAVLAGHDSL